MIILYLIQTSNDIQQNLLAIIFWALDRIITLNLLSAQIDRIVICIILCI